MNLNANQRLRGIVTAITRNFYLLLSGCINFFYKLKKCKDKCDLRHAMLIIVLSLPTISQATIINYTASDLGGGDWRYDYTVKNDNLVDPIMEFTIYFEPNLYENLAVVSSPLDWDPIVVQPDTGLPADGFFDALSLFTGLAPGDSAGLFSVSFHYIGADSPSGQSFETYSDADFTLLDRGTATSTTNAVPEPYTIALLALGFILLIGFKRRQNAFCY